MTAKQTIPAAIVLLTLIAMTANAQYDIPWYSIDGGGEMFSTGGDYELSGTIGQPDASTVVMTGGDFRLSGGFWAAASTVTILPGDLNCDGEVNFGDINPFVLALSDPSGYQAQYDCYDNGDCNEDGEVNFGDINPFVMLLTGG